MDFDNITLTNLTGSSVDVYKNSVVVGTISSTVTAQVVTSTSDGPEFTTGGSAIATRVTIPTTVVMDYTDHLSSLPPVTAGTYYIVTAEIARTFKYSDMLYLVIDGGNTIFVRAGNNTR